MPSKSLSPHLVLVAQDIILLAKDVRSKKSKICFSQLQLPTYITRSQGNHKACYKLVKCGLMVVTKWLPPPAPLLSCFRIGGQLLLFPAAGWRCKGDHDQDFTPHQHVQLYWNLHLMNPLIRPHRPLCWVDLLRLDLETTLAVQTQRRIMGPTD